MPFESGVAENKGLDGLEDKVTGNLRKISVATATLQRADNQAANPTEGLRIQIEAGRTGR